MVNTLAPLVIMLITFGCPIGGLMLASSLPDGPPRPWYLGLMLIGFGPGFLLGMMFAMIFHAGTI